jgi:nicotinate-nucleotide adenylyltransferase
VTASAPVLLLGGSFNPVHIGHLRIALECREALQAAKTLFIPASVPPHKPDARLLPFPLRVALLRACTDRLPASFGLEVCELENSRPGPSYTVDTLRELACRHPGTRPAFVMGGEDYAKLSTWKRWREFPRYADIVIAPRGDSGRVEFMSTTEAYWPGAVLVRNKYGRGLFQLPGGGAVYFLPQPLLEISSSMIRERFLAGRSLDFLVPRPALDLLYEQEAEVRGIWGLCPNDSF